MNASERITPTQLFRLIVILVLPTAVLSIPTICIQQAGNGGWLSPVISMMVGVLVFWVMHTLAKAYPGQTFVEYTARLMGRVGGKVMGTLYGLFFWTTGLIIIREMVGLLQVAVYMRTPAYMINLSIFGAMVYMLYCGLEGIARVIDLLYAFIFVLTVAFVLAPFDAFHANAFLPMLDKGWTGILRGAFVPASWYGEIVLIGMLLPSVTVSRKIAAFSLLGLGVTTLALVLIIAVVISVMGAEEAARLPFPTYNVIRYFQWGEFFQHVDVLFLLPWTAMMILKALIFYYSGALSWAQTFKLSQYRVLIVPLFLFSVILSLWMFPDEIGFHVYLQYVYPNYALLIEFVLPSILLCVHFFRKRLAKEV